MMFHSRVITDYVFFQSVISNFIKDLVIGKVAGPDNLAAEYLKHAHTNLSVLFSLCLIFLMSVT